MKDLTEHFKFMRDALRVSEEALSANEVPIGCVFVLNGKEVIANGRNNTNESLSGIEHAEFKAIEKIFKRYEHLTQKQVIDDIFSNCDLYVTVEPCIMCASALRQLRIKRVIFGAGNDRFGGNGTVVSCHLGYPENCDSGNYPREYLSFPGILNKELILMLRRFYLNENDKAPNPKVKKTRNFVDDDFPLIDFQKYLTKAEFVDFYGEERLDVFDGLKNEILDTSLDDRKHLSEVEFHQEDESKKRKTV